MSLCYRPLDQNEQVDEVLYRQMGAYSFSQVMVLMVPFSHLIIYLRDNTTGHKQFRRFLECNFLAQVIEESVRRGAMLDLILTNKGLAGGVKGKGSLSCSYHEIVEFRILREGGV